MNFFTILRILSCFYANRLHRNEDKLQTEQQADDRYHDVLLLELAGADRDDSVSDGADADTVGDGVSQRHRDQRQKRRCCGAEVTHIHILEVAKHQHADIDQCRSCRAGRNDAGERCQEQAYEEADRYDQRGQSCSAACGYAGRGFYEGRTGGSTQNRAGYGRDGVTSHALVEVLRVAVFIQKVRLRRRTVQGTDGVEHVDQAEGNDVKDRTEYTADELRTECVLPRCRLEYARHADICKVLKGLSDLCDIEGRHSTGENIVEHSRNHDAEQHVSLHIAFT